MPKGRQTWCSNTCYAKFGDIQGIKRAVWERDRGMCQICGADIASVAKIHMRAVGRSVRPWFQYRHAEYDHIIPFSEGGLTTVENLRTLCGPCHKTRTAEWRKARAKRDDAAEQGSLALV